MEDPCQGPDDTEASDWEVCRRIAHWADVGQRRVIVTLRKVTFPRRRLNCHLQGLPAPGWATWLVPAPPFPQSPQCEGRAKGGRWWLWGEE